MFRHLSLAAALLLCACGSNEPEFTNVDNIDDSINAAIEEPDLKNEVNAPLSDNLAQPEVSADEGYDELCKRGESEYCYENRVGSPHLDACDPKVDECTNEADHNEESH